VENSVFQESVGAEPNCGGLGLFEELNWNEKPECFPNPTTDEVSIKGLPVDFQGKISILNQYGQLFWESDYQTKLNLEQFPDGIYIVLISNEFSLFTTKFLKRH
jgi:hypothetical protein